MPIIPIEPAKLVRKVLPFLVFKLFNDKERAVANDIERFLSRFSFFFEVSLIGVLSFLEVAFSALS